MRILPLVFYVERMGKEKQFEITHQVSCITHGHIRSQMACGIYVQLGINLLNVYEREISDATSRNFCRNFMIFSGAENRCTKS